MTTVGHDPIGDFMAGLFKGAGSILAGGLQGMSDAYSGPIGFGNAAGARVDAASQAAGSYDLPVVGALNRAHDVTVNTLGLPSFLGGLPGFLGAVKDQGWQGAVEQSRRLNAQAPEAFQGQHAVQDFVAPLLLPNPIGAAGALTRLPGIGQMALRAAPYAHNALQGAIGADMAQQQMYTPPPGDTSGVMPVGQRAVGDLAGALLGAGLKGAGVNLAGPVSGALLGAGAGGVAAAGGIGNAPGDILAGTALGALLHRPIGGLLQPAAGVRAGLARNDYQVQAGRLGNAVEGGYSNADLHQAMADAAALPVADRAAYMQAWLDDQFRQQYGAAAGPAAPPASPPPPGPTPGTPPAGAGPAMPGGPPASPAVPPPTTLPLPGMPAAPAAIAAPAAPPPPRGLRTAPMAQQPMTEQLMRRPPAVPPDATELFPGADQTPPPPPASAEAPPAPAQPGAVGYMPVTRLIPRMAPAEAAPIVVRVLDESRGRLWLEPNLPREVVPDAQGLAARLGSDLQRGSTPAVDRIQQINRLVDEYRQNGILSAHDTAELHDAVSMINNLGYRIVDRGTTPQRALSGFSYEREQQAAQQQPALPMEQAPITAGSPEVPPGVTERGPQPTAYEREQQMRQVDRQYQIASSVSGGVVGDPRLQAALAQRVAVADTRQARIAREAQINTQLGDTFGPGAVRPSGWGDKLAREVGGFTVDGSGKRWTVSGPDGQPLVGGLAQLREARVAAMRLAENADNPNLPQIAERLRRDVYAPLDDLTPPPAEQPPPGQGALFGTPATKADLIAGAQRPQGGLFDEAAGGGGGGGGGAFGIVNNRAQQQANRAWGWWTRDYHAPKAAANASPGMVAPEDLEALAPHYEALAKALSKAGPTNASEGQSVVNDLMAQIAAQEQGTQPGGAMQAYRTVMGPLARGGREYSAAVTGLSPHVPFVIQPFHDVFRQLASGFSPSALMGKIKGGLGSAEYNQQKLAQYDMTALPSSISENHGGGSDLSGQGTLAERVAPGMFTQMAENALHSRSGPYWQTIDRGAAQALPDFTREVATAADASSMTPVERDALVARVQQRRGQFGPATLGDLLTSSGMDADTAAPLVQRWSETLQPIMADAERQALYTVGDHRTRTNLDAIIGPLAPFTNWSSRNVEFWTNYLANHPQVYAGMQGYGQEMEREREARHGSARLKGQLLLPGGYSVNPMNLLSLTTQFNEPPVRDEEQTTPMQGALDTLGALGLRPFPWLGWAGQATGALPREWQGTMLPVSRNVEALSGYNPERPALEAINALLDRATGKTVRRLTDDPYIDRAVQKRIDEMSIEQTGLPAARSAQFRAAMWDASSPIFQQAYQDVTAARPGQRALATISPIRVGYEPPAERTIRDAMGQEQAATNQQLSPLQQRLWQQFQQVPTEQREGWIQNLRGAQRDAFDAMREVRRREAANPTVPASQGYQGRYDSPEAARIRELQQQYDSLGTPQEQATWKGLAPTLLQLHGADLDQAVNALPPDQQRAVLNVLWARRQFLQAPQNVALAQYKQFVRGRVGSDPDALPNSFSFLDDFLKSEGKPTQAGQTVPAGTGLPAAPGRDPNELLQALWQQVQRIGPNTALSPQNRLGTTFTGWARMQGLRPNDPAVMQRFVEELQRRPDLRQAAGLP